MAPDDETSRRAGSTRRQFLFGGAVAGVGAAAAIGIDAALNRSEPAAPQDPAPLNGAQTVAFHGAHQAGIATAAQAHGLFIAIDLHDDVDRGALRRMMRVLSDDASRLTQGTPALADSEPELAANPARLTVTFGFGPGFVARARGEAPTWLRALPAFGIDRLQPEFCDGDLLVQIGSDDPITLAHAARMLLKSTRAFGDVRWSQQGFRQSYGSVRPGTTMRNLFGQVDGTTNPEPGTDDFDRLVWAQSGWLAGGTGIVVRRIRMNLDTWDELNRDGREQAVGRTLGNGAPLTGTDEFDEPDFEARTPLGFPVIPEFSHLRRARMDDTSQRIFRRAYNYDERPAGASVSNSGLIFVSYQADVDNQFVPIQRSLDELDLLNQWTTPIGSAVFAIPPGCAEGGFVGDTLLA